MNFPPQPQYLRCGGGAALAVLLALALGLTGACGQTVEVGVDDALTEGGAASGSAGVGGALQLGGATFGGSSAAASSNQGGAPACVETQCRGKLYQCGDCSDDDGDGLVDAFDPDCVGPCDDDELGLGTGLKTNQAACRKDCYFDGDNGAGNDKCEWSQACDPLSVAPDYPPSGEARCEYGGNMGGDCEALSAAQPQTCLDACLGLVPNGCDCFGCCELPGGSGNFHYLAEGCQRATLGDPLLCPPCTPVPSCFNDCAKCETCVDKPPEPGCSSASGCADGAAECSEEAPCEFGSYCVTGCCVTAPEPT